MVVAAASDQPMGLLPVSRTVCRMRLRVALYVAWP
jgi:hypothetical protein